MYHICETFKDIQNKRKSRKTIQTRDFVLVLCLYLILFWFFVCTWFCSGSLQSGTVVCTRETCPPITCSFNLTVKSDDSCCRVCPQKELCHYEGSIYQVRKSPRMLADTVTLHVKANVHTIFWRVICLKVISLGGRISVWNHYCLWGIDVRGLRWLLFTTNSHPRIICQKENVWWIKLHAPTITSKSLVIHEHWPPRIKVFRVNNQLF